MPQPPQADAALLQIGAEPCGGAGRLCPVTAAVAIAQEEPVSVLEHGPR